MAGQATVTDDDGLAELLRHLKPAWQTDALSSGRRRVDSAALDAPHRLARYLVELSESGTDTGAAEIDIPLTQEEVATLIATSRESVVRALASLRSRGLVTTARRRITIRDLDGLRQYAGW